MMLSPVSQDYVSPCSHSQDWSIIAHIKILKGANPNRAKGYLHSMNSCIWCWKSSMTDHALFWIFNGRPFPQPSFITYSFSVLYNQSKSTLTLQRLALTLVAVSTLSNSLLWNIWYILYFSTLLHLMCCLLWNIWTTCSDLLTPCF